MLQGRVFPPFEPVLLKLYSNNQMWAQTENEYNDYITISERCVRISGHNKEQLHELSGLNLVLESSERGKYHLFICLACFII